MSHRQQHQVQKSKQKLIQDQNFSHNILFMALSTAESLAQRINKNQNFSNKLFKNYDLVNYSSKETNQLKSQLGLQLMILSQSFKTFQGENPNVQWSWPSNYSIQKFQQKLAQFNKIFKENKEHECSKLIDDFYQIVTKKKRPKNQQIEKKSQKKNNIFKNQSGQRIFEIKKSQTRTQANKTQKIKSEENQQTMWGKLISSVGNQIKNLFKSQPNQIKHKQSITQKSNPNQKQKISPSAIQKTRPEVVLKAKQHIKQMQLEDPNSKQSLSKQQTKKDPNLIHKVTQIQQAMDNENKKMQKVKSIRELKAKQHINQVQLEDPNSKQSLSKQQTKKNPNLIQPGEGLKTKQHINQVQLEDSNSKQSQSKQQPKKDPNLILKVTQIQQAMDNENKKMQKVKSIRELKANLNQEHQGPKQADSIKSSS